jgi:heme oxygenase
VPESMALCEWCRRRRVERRGARYCSHPCQQRAYEWRRRVDHLVADMSLANRHTREAIQRLQEILGKRTS